MTQVTQAKYYWINYCLISIFLTFTSCNSNELTENNQRELDSINLKINAPDQEFQNIAPSEIVVSCEAKGKSHYCSFHNYQSVLTQTEDEKGNGDSFSTLEKKTANSYESIQTKDFFIANSSPITEKIHTEMKKTYNYLKADYAGEEEECMAELSPKEKYGFEDVSIFFDDKGVYFQLEFGFSAACIALDGHLFFLNWDEVKPFVKY